MVLLEISLFVLLLGVLFAARDKNRQVDCQYVEYYELAIPFNSDQYSLVIWANDFSAKYYLILRMIRVEAGYLFFKRTTTHYVTQ